MSRTPTGIQLWSVRNSCGKDLEGTLEQLAEIGYDGVEFAGFHDHTPERIREILDSVGLKCCGNHVRLAGLFEDALDETVAIARTLGTQYLVITSIRDAEYAGTPEAWRRTADLLSDRARRAEDLGMRLAFHNHYQEFEPWDGSTQFEILFDNAAPEVGMQLDIGWAVRAGRDPAEILRRYPGRARTVHVREYAADNANPILGQGEVDWPSVFAALEAVGGAEWQIIERQHQPEGELEAAAASLEALRRMGR